LGDQYFITPQSVYHEDKGEPEYFDVMGATALKKREELKIPPEGEVVPISRKYKVHIEVQKGMAYTREGQKNYAKELGDYFIQLAQLGVINPQTVTMFVEALMESYEFGPAADIMEEIKKQGEMGVPDPMLEKMKIAMAEVIKDTGVGEKEEQDEARDVEKAKVGAMEAISDTIKAQGGS
jgi:hypothetical protein